jgi:hypothetical protein
MASFLSLSLPKLNLIKASSAATTTTTTTTPESLNEKYGRKGIKFLESNSIPIVELTVRNGSSLSLRLPDAHVTSYKPKVFWKDDGCEEFLYTIPANETGLYKAKGGIGLVFNEVLQPGAKELFPSTLEWTVNDVDYDSIDALQVPFHSGVGHRHQIIIILNCVIFSNYYPCRRTSVQCLCPCFIGCDYGSMFVLVVVGGV